ncbi:hypothetical protein ACFL5Q_03105 [Planctomycetota bacterium]
MSNLKARPEKPCRRKRIRRVALVLALLACAWLCYPVILRTVARGLIAGRQQNGADYVWIRSDGGPCPDGDRSYDQAARLYHEDTSRGILLMEPKPSRLVEIGALPGFEPAARRQLAARGVPERAVTLLDGEPETHWDEARLLTTWMNDHPGSEVLLLCDRFGSRRWRYVLDTVLEPDHAARTGILALRDRRYDETNWWKSRGGAKSLFYGYVCLAYAWRCGEAVPQRMSWNADEYERMLQAAGREGR